MVVITSAIVLASLALIGLIVAVSGAVMLAPFMRDIVTGESTAVELAETDVINNILADPDLTNDEKIKLILEFIKSEEDDWTKDAVKIVFIIAVLYIAMLYFKK